MYMYVFIYIYVCVCSLRSVPLPPNQAVPGRYLSACYLHEALNCSRAPRAYLIILPNSFCDTYRSRSRAEFQKAHTGDDIDNYRQQEAPLRHGI